MAIGEGAVEGTLLIVLGYILGSISFSTLVARKMAGIDIREHGSRNAGATNTLRVLGVGPALFVLVLDTLKGVIPVLLAMRITGEPSWIVLSGLAAIIGHNWPVFFSFRGGKGVATTIGVATSFAFIPSLIAGMFAIIVIILFRYVSVGSLCFVSLLPVMLFIFQYPLPYILGTLVIGLLSFWRHRTNIIRLVQGKENKLGGRP